VRSHDSDVFCAMLGNEFYLPAVKPFTRNAIRVAIEHVYAAIVYLYVALHIPYNACNVNSEKTTRIRF